jgi:hypothetical protein
VCQNVGLGLLPAFCATTTICLSVCLSVVLPVFLAACCLSVSLSLFLSIGIPVGLSFDLSVCYSMSVIIYMFSFAYTKVWALHFSRESMFSSHHGTTEEFLDDLKPGWGAKYGPTLQASGLEDLGDAQDLSEVELNDLLG